MGVARRQERVRAEVSPEEDGGKTLCLEHLVGLKYNGKEKAWSS